MEMSELLMFVGEMLLVAALVIVAFNLLVLWLSRRIEAHVSQELNEVVEELAQNRLIPLTIEQYQDQYLCYHSFTMDFVCQGADLDEIIEKFKTRYPGKSASLYNGDNTALQVLKKQLQEIKNENSSSI
jgi:hypothetical protein